MYFLPQAAQAAWSQKGPAVPALAPITVAHWEDPLHVQFA
jgi:hypothetical protein